MTISAVWSGVLSWLKKWRLTRWEFDPRTIEMRRRIYGIREEADQLDQSLRNSNFQRDQFERVAFQRLEEIQSLKGANDLLRLRLASEREENANALAVVRQRYDGHPDIDTYKKCLDELRQKHDAAVALSRSREEEITKLNREYATLRAEHEKMFPTTPEHYAILDRLEGENAELRRKVGQSTTIRKLQLAREESKRLRAKLAAITDRNGAIFDHPEYRKVARRLRAARARLPRGGLITFDGVPLRRSPFVGQPFCVNRFAPSPEIAYVEERQYGTAPSRSINTDILDTICGVTQVPQSERGPLVNGC